MARNWDKLESLIVGFHVSLFQEYNIDEICDFEDTCEDEEEICELFSNIRAENLKSLSINSLYCEEDLVLNEKSCKLISDAFPNLKHLRVINGIEDLNILISDKFPNLKSLEDCSWRAPTRKESSGSTGKYSANKEWQYEHKN